MITTVVYLSKTEELSVNWISITHDPNVLSKSEPQPQRKLIQAKVQRDRQPRPRRFDVLSLATVSTGLSANFCAGVEAA